MKIRPPGGVPPVTVKVGKALALSDAAGQTTIASVIYARKVAQGKRGTMVLLAVAPTAAALAGATPPRPRAPHGDWVVEIAFGRPSAAGSKEVAVVHAWSERNDLVYRSPRRQQATLTGDDPVPALTENSPSSLRFCGINQRYATEDAPKPFQPELSLSSSPPARRQPIPACWATGWSLSVATERATAKWRRTPVAARRACRPWTTRAWPGWLRDDHRAGASDRRSGTCAHRPRSRRGER
ncbi:MAG: hypothetical protein U1F25_12600 [Rubrivivax sp.]